MRKALHATALVLVLAAQATSGGCQDTGTLGYSCHVETRGLEIENGYVTDVVRNWCEPGLEPKRQMFSVWIETRRGPGDGWLLTGRRLFGATGLC
jgi:hypothetical protein